MPSKISLRLLKKMKKVLEKVSCVLSVLKGISGLEHSVLNVVRELNIPLNSFVNEI